MFNTWGLRSINLGTFNNIHCDDYWGSGIYLEKVSCPKESRDIIVTLFKVHNLVFNTLDYIPGISWYSGHIRIGIGVCIYIGTRLIGDRNAKSGPLIGRFYDEALSTATAQIVRGVVTAYASHARIINGILDCIGTSKNRVNDRDIAYYKQKGCAITTCLHSHDDPRYPFPLGFLNWA